MMKNTQNFVPLNVYTVSNFRNSNQIPMVHKVQLGRTNYFTRHKVQPIATVMTSSTYNDSDITMDDLQEKPNRRRRRLCGTLWLILLVLFIIIVIAVPITLTLLFLFWNTARTDNTTVITSTNTVSTVALNSCISPYVLAPSGRCVNTMIDFNNCGTVDYICPSNYTSCSAGVCSTAPAVQLANPISIWTAPINGAVDDSMYNVILPFNITLYTTTTDHVTVTTNGVLCLSNCATTWTETTLPASYFAGATALAYWDDLYIYASTSQGIYYAAEGDTPNRTLIFEYYMSHYMQPTQYYHYQMIFFEDVPGIVQYKYFDASDGGVTCTIGVQASSTGPFIQYSFDQANSVRSNMSLIFDTNLGIYTNATF